METPKKICLIAYDSSFQIGRNSGTINGGTAWLWHLMHTFQSMGHEAFMVDNGSYIPDADIYIIQSEWYGTQGQPERFEEMRKKGSKLVVILGHFISSVYFDPRKIEADLFVSTWKGEVVNTFKQEVKFWPHAYCEACDSGDQTISGDLIWIGNNYPLRKEHWLEGLGLTRVQGIMPDKVNGVYRGAVVCPNLHGDFQKGKVSTEPSTLADLPGFAVNERLFQICGAGGFQIADNNPQIREFFDEDEVICCQNKAEFHEKIGYYLAHPEERLPFIEKAKEKILNKHTYRHRCEQLLEWLK